MLYVCAKHFTDDCFLNLGQYRDGLAERLKIKSGSVPTLLGSATNLGQVSQLTQYNFVALLYMVKLPSLLSLECGCNISSAANSPVTVANVKVDSIKYVCVNTHTVTRVLYIYLLCG